MTRSEELAFVYTGRPGRVIFERGARAKVVEELERLGVSSAIIITTPAQADVAEEFASALGKRAGVVYTGAAQHTPTEVTEDAMETLRSAGANGCLAIGGGSTIGLSKAIALRTDLPQLVVPTTFAGSEMTPILGQTQAGRKTTLTDPKVQPETVIYDPDLLATLPREIAGPSALNAIAHSMEALYAREANPVIDMFAEESIRALGESVPVFMGEGDPAHAYETALYGAWLGGICLGSVGMAIHHKICHTLGGTFDLNHADVHCLMLPYSAAYNREAAPRAMAAIARALGADDGPKGLFRLMQVAARVTSLRDFGLTEADLDRAADLSVENPYWNPRPVTREGVREMLQQAWQGQEP
ncbi:maleylacetate reductase [Rubellimicrobium rubrum]|uniref:Maleylacetate reductase n=1 Tax=Rubellimicrobium rubrum TaxID=2585369 RepID=A0A5C4MSI9_9RHOB|nr:maleylacetate reductase [Rubellimicrobium rubrum]TNC47286.1 maleylacetate reductase [Rubellimicrobium rubrum]